MIYKSLKQYNWKGKLILIVEDDPASVLFLEEILKTTGIEILVVETGKGAIEICKKNEKIDLVLMDMQLPVMSGYEATKKIKTHRGNLPVIATTAYVLIDEQDKCFECGCDDYIAKPINIFELMSKINRLLHLPEK